jgi:hypothetical protein
MAQIKTKAITDDAVGLAQMAVGTDGNIISYDASTNPVAIATGSDGQVLTSTGAGSPPAFEAIPASGVSLSGSTNNTVATVSGANALVGEATMTYDATTLSIIPTGTQSNIRLQNSTTGSNASDGFLIQETGNDTYLVNYENAGMYFRTNNTDHMQITAGGAVTKPQQPVFLVRPTSDQVDLPTGSTTVAWGAEIFDVGSNFASNTFTAPVTGKYQFNLSAYLNKIDVDTTLFEFNFVSSNRLQRLMIRDFSKDYTADSNEFVSMNASAILDMDANDTVYVRIDITGGGGVIHLNGSAPSSAFYTSWSGALIC